MNWTRIIQLLLPIKLRRATRLLILMAALLKHTTKDADAAVAHRDAVEEDVRHLGQYGVVLLEVRKYCRHWGCYISDSVDGNILIFWRNGPIPGDNVVCGRVLENPPAHRVIIHDVASSDIGSDCVVHVPRLANANDVYHLVRRYVFAGIGFTVVKDI